MKPCSPKRLVLAIYVDFLLFETVLQLGSWLVARRPFTGPFVLNVLAFMGIQLLAWNHLGGSPGAWALGIVRRDGTREVLPSVAARERWWTVLVGMLALLSGAKEATRWTLGLPPPPFMGLALSWDAAAAVITTSGIASIAVGLGVLRTSARAALLGVAINVVTLSSWLVGTDQIPAWVEARTRAQEAQHGVPSRPGDVERLTLMLRGGALFGGVAGAAWLLLVWHRFRTLDAVRTDDALP